MTNAFLLQESINDLSGNIFQGFKGTVVKQIGHDNRCSRNSLQITPTVPLNNKKGHSGGYQVLYRGVFKACTGGYLRPVQGGI